jgi:hypothetical protein
MDHQCGERRTFAIGKFDKIINNCYFVLSTSVFASLYYLHGYAQSDTLYLRQPSFAISLSIRLVKADVRN